MVTEGNNTRIIPNLAAHETIKSQDNLMNLGIETRNIYIELLKLRAQSEHVCEGGEVTPNKVKLKQSPELS